MQQYPARGQPKKTGVRLPVIHLQSSSSPQKTRGLYETNCGQKIRNIELVESPHWTNVCQACLTAYYQSVKSYKAQYVAIKRVEC